jgi:hypothetical protein
MEHLLNCHGEWAMLAAFLSAIPVLGPWLRVRFSRPHIHKDVE